jgi:archaellin
MSWGRAELVVPVHVAGTRDTDQVAAIEAVTVTVMAAVGATAAVWRTDPPRYELTATITTTSEDPTP